MNILYQKGNKLLSTWAFNFWTLQYANGDQSDLFSCAL